MQPATDPDGTQRAKNRNKKMGFINYRGKKEDRYSEILNYSRAQQDDEWKRKEDERVGVWLMKFTGDGKFVTYNLQKLLKLIMSLYRELFDTYKKIFVDGTVPDNCYEEQLWKDFSIDLVDRHIRFYHVTIEDREKDLQMFIDRIFKLSGTVSAVMHIEYLAERSDYNKYFSECFDPFQTGRYFYHLVRYVGKNNNANVDVFFDYYKKLILTLGMFFYQAFRPRNNGWTKLLETEIIAVENIQEQHRKNEHIIINSEFLKNPLYHMALFPHQNDQNYLD